MLSMSNPLLAERSLPAFAAIRPEHIQPAVEKVIADNRAAIDAITAEPGPHTWYSLVAPLERLEDRLEQVWAPVSHLNAVMNSEALREAYNACLPMLSAYHTDMGQNTALYGAFRELSESDDYERLDQDQRQSVDNALRDFQLAGVALNSQAKQRYAEIAARLSELSARFQEHLLDATDAWHHDIIDADALAGVPDSALGVMAQSAREACVEGWRVSLDMPVVQAILGHARNPNCAPRCTRPLPLGHPTLDRKPVSSITIQSCVRFWICVPNKPSCWATPTTQRYRLHPKWRTPLSRSSTF